MASGQRGIAGRAMPWLTDTPPAAYFLGGKLTAQVAQNALLAALLITAGTRGDGAIGLSAFFVATLIPSFFLGPLGGLIVDRLGPSAAYAFGAAGRALAVVPALFLTGSPHMVWVVAALYSTASQVFTPAEFALIRDVQGARPGRLYSAQTVVQYAGQGTGLLIVAPLLFFFGGQPAVFVGVIWTFALTAVFGSLLASRGLGRAIEEPESGPLAGFRPVARFLFSDGRAFYAMIALMLSAIISRVLVVSIPGYVRDEISIGAMGLVLIAVPGVIGIIAGLVWTTQKLSIENAGTMLRASSLALMGALFVLAFVDNGVTFAAQNSHMSTVANLESSMNTTAATVVPAALAGGFGMVVVLMAGRFVLAELSPEGRIGRVYAVQSLISEAVLMLPLMLAGVATTLAGTRVTLSVVGLIALTTLIVTELRRGDRKLSDAGVFSPAPVITQPVD